MTNTTSSALADDLRSLLAAARGQPPSAQAVSVLGGWERIAADGAATADDPVLVPLVALIARESANPDNRPDAYAAAIRAVTEAITRSIRPAIFNDSLSILLGCPAAVAEISDSLADELNQIVRDFTKINEPDSRTAQRAADALTGLTRLSLIQLDQPYELLALLGRFNTPLPKPLATAVIRAVGTAVDYWPHATSLTRVVRVVAGLDKPAGPPIPSVDPEDIGSDATWVLAGIELVTALRESDLRLMASHLRASAGYLSTAHDNYEREDAGALLGVVETLIALLRHSSDRPPNVEALTIPALDPESLAALSEQVRRINVASIGLNHWYGDPKRAALAAWSRFADELGRLRDELDRDSFYHAAVLVDHLLQIYMGSRSVQVVRNPDDADGLLTLVQPIIETGFARTAGLLSNLHDHAEALEQQVVRETDENHRLVLAGQLEAAREVLAAAQTHALGGAGQGKDRGGTADAPLPPPLSQLLPSDSDAVRNLRTWNPAALAELAHAVSDRTTSRKSLSLTESDVYDAICSALQSSPDYRGDVRVAVNELLRIIIRFVTTRTNAQSNLRPYLFDPEAKEDKIHLDLNDFLASSELGSYVRFEEPHVGGGRIDLRLTFDGFAINIEMKVDSTKLPMSDRTAYLKQAAAYQVTDVRIGFLIALRHKAFDPTGPPPHLSELVGHTPFDINEDPVPRHIITVQIPGSRTKPSDMR
ncbi:hypothetical protein ACI2K4_09350 [Micromonospora sp. NPDC050397]|uniref:hypothetical protein n=1 Tax=Micromonospora sp. NPDC050397 TaxID=3364279 RepID=UPI003851492C